MMMMIYNILK